MLNKPRFERCLATTLLLVFSGLTASLGLVSYREIISEPLSLPEADALVSLLGVTQEKGMQWPGGWSTAAFSALGVFQTQNLNIGEDARRQQTVLACLADPGFFNVLAVGPELGRLLNKDDGLIGAPPVAVVSHSFWTGHFGGSADLSTAKLFAGGRWIQVVGVLPARVDFPAHAAVYLPHPDQRLFSPAAEKERWSADDISRGDDRVLARLRQGVTVAQADAMLKAVSVHLRKVNTDPHHGFGVVGVRRLRDIMIFNVKNQMTTISLAGCCVALAALFSLLFLSTARSAELRKDIAIRAALGAGPSQLALRELIRWIGIGALASTAIVGLELVVLRVLRQLEGLAIPRLADLSLTLAQAIWTVAGTMTVAVLLSTPYLIACGNAEPVAPVLNRNEMLSRLAVRPWIGRIVSVCQLSLALALTAVALRVSVNYWRLSTIPPGIDASGVFVSRPIPAAALNLGNQPSLAPDEDVSVSPAAGDHTSKATLILDRNAPGQTSSKLKNGSHYEAQLFLQRRESPEERVVRQSIEQQETARVLGEVTRQPDVASAALIDPVPYEDAAGSGQFVAVDGKESEEALPVFHVRGDIPRTLGLQVIRGRWFDAQDDKVGTNVVVVGNALANEYFAGRAIGRSIVIEETGADFPRTIIGVVGDVVSNYGIGPLAAVYIPMSSHADSGSIVVKMAPGVKRAPFPIRNVPGNLLQFQPWTSMEKMMSDAGATDRASATVAAWFAILVLLLSAAGAYAVFWMITIQRQREMAIRICFGALPAKVALGLVLNAIVLACCAGIGGFAIQQGMQRVLSSRIYHFPAFSWTTFLVSFGVITVATLLSVARPARSVLRISPAELLRDN